MALAVAVVMPAESALATRRALPLRALLDRLGSGAAASSPWAAYLPEKLQPPELRAAKAQAAAAAAAAGSGAAQAAPNTRNRKPSAAAGVDCSSDTSSFNMEEIDIAGRVWSLSQEPVGCRQVQRVLDEATSDAERIAIAGELQGHIYEAAKCPHANHVLQKVIALLPPRGLQSIIDEVMAGSLGQLAKHKYACRIVQRLVEHGSPQHMDKLVDKLLSDFVALSKHSYGNYVVQGIVQHGTEEQRARITRASREEIRLLGSEIYGCAVIAAALSSGPGADRLALAEALLEEPGLLVYMASSRHGHAAALQVLDILEGSDFEEACSKFFAEAEQLRHSRYGRVVVERVEDLDAQRLVCASRGGA